MKLWIKISIVCAAVLLIIVAFFSGLLLEQARDNMLDMAEGYAKSKQHDLQTSFAEMANYYLDESAGDTVEYSLVDYCFKRFADQEGVLVNDGKTICSQVSVSPEELLPLGDYGQHTQLEEIQARNILIVGNITNVRSNVYWVYIVQDITPVYDNIAQMVWRFVLIAAVCVLTGTTLIILLVRNATKPLMELSVSTKQIAGGDYTRRANIITRDEVGQLAGDFNQMASAVELHIAELMETTERQRLFIGGVTHEFKTPMTSLLIHSDTLLNARLTEEESNRSLKHIHGQIEWLEQLTQKLLKLVTLNEAITLKEYSVQKLFDAVHISMAEALAQRNTPLIIECAANTLSMDADLMQSLLINLVDNASKASKPGQSILLSAKYNTIQVTDHGSGMPKSEVARVTEPFYMVDSSRSKKKGGFGLGLALVKQIADAHCAQLRIESEMDKGTTVKIIFCDNTSLTF